MTDLTKFKKEIVRYVVVMALAAEVISLPVIGVSLMFTAGLVVGTAVTILNFTLLVKAGEKVMEQNRAMPMVGGYFVRLVIYGAVFVAAVKFGFHAAVGCALGFVTLHVSIMFTYLIVYGLFKKEKNPLNDWTEPKEWNDLSVYDDEDDDWNK
ncbi:MAG: hypothetical protein IJ070_01805 [Firmicutes bacterium]|nr:hypothetical protein [Bacillota bacterium]MBQ9708418.1 hypothetical protein [Bacillota bacterium]